MRGGKRGESFSPLSALSLPPVIGCSSFLVQALGGGGVIRIFLRFLGSLMAAWVLGRPCVPESHGWGFSRGSCVRRGLDGLSWLFSTSVHCACWAWYEHFWERTIQKLLAFVKTPALIFEDCSSDPIPSEKPSCALGGSQVKGFELCSLQPVNLTFNYMSCLSPWLQTISSEGRCLVLWVLL